MGIIILIIFGIVIVAIISGRGNGKGWAFPPALLHYAGGRLFRTSLIAHPPRSPMAHCGGRLPAVLHSLTQEILNCRISDATIVSNILKI